MKKKSDLLASCFCPKFTKHQYLVDFWTESVSLEWKHVFLKQAAVTAADQETPLPVWRAEAEPESSLKSLAVDFAL